MENNKIRLVLLEIEFNWKFEPSALAWRFKEKIKESFKNNVFKNILLIIGFNKC